MATNDALEFVREALVGDGGPTPDSIWTLTSDVLLMRLGEEVATFSPEHMTAATTKTSKTKWSWSPVGVSWLLPLLSKKS